MASVRGCPIKTFGHDDPTFEGVQLQIYPNLGALFIRRNEVTVSSSMSKSPGCRPKLARYAEILRSYLAQNDMPGLGGNLGYISEIVTIQVDNPGEG